MVSAIGKWVLAGIDVTTPTSCSAVGWRAVPKSRKCRPKKNRAHPQKRNSRRRTEPDLLDDVRRALDSGQPLDLLAQASILLTALDPRRRSPFDLDDEEDLDELPSREELITSFLDVPARETSALLAAMRSMLADELTAARIDRELAARVDVLPAWLTGLGATRIERTIEMTHVLRDGDDVLIGARLGSGHPLTALVYIDHNLGIVVKDAFVIAEPVDDVIALVQAEASDPDTTCNDLEHAAARARVTEAIGTGASTFPPLESETWPACRPLVEWLVGLLPSGGVGYQWPDWDDDAREDLAERFFGSTLGRRFDDDDHRELFGSLLSLSCDYAPGDPLRWSPSAVEIILLDRFPRKVIAPASHLAKLPDLLRAFIRFAHAQREIRPALTDEVLAAVDELDGEYQALIASPRPQGPAALLAAVGALDVDDAIDWEDDLLPSIEEIMIERLTEEVGSEQALQALDAEPLPDEAFDWRGIPTDVQERVSRVLGLVEHCGETFYDDPEYRTAGRRLLAAVAGGDPEVFRRRGRDETAAAALCWIIGKANDAFTFGSKQVKDLTAHFGLSQGGASQRAATLLRAGGFPADTYAGISLGSPDYLVSAHRKRMIELRDRYSAAASRAPQ
jgi:hypothetical protein